MPPDVNFTPKLSPSKLSYLAGNVVLKCLANASKKLDSIFDSPGGPVLKPDPSIMSQEASSMNPNSRTISSAGSRISSATSDVSEISPELSSKVVRNIVMIKGYIRSRLSKKARVELLKLAATFAVMSSNIPIIRFVMTNDVEHLDFTGSDYWLMKQVTLNDLYGSAMLGDGVNNNTMNGVPILPPNEFDWYSADRMGRIITMNDALELFSIISSSHCMEKLKTLKINVRRATYCPCRKDSMYVFDSVYTKLHMINELVIRGMADDNLLKVIGKTYVKLKLLDVSYSQFVTDQGIRQLFFDDLDAPAILFTLPSWIQHSAKNMNAVSRSLDVFDFSHTKVTWDSVAMMSCVPAAYVFRRNFATSASIAFGHTVFVRKQPEFSATIQRDLSGVRGVLPAADSNMKTELIKLLETQLWDGCHLHVFKGLKQHYRFAFITTSKDEKFVEAFFNFNEQGVKSLYSARSVSMDLIGEACPSIESLQVILIGKWTQISTVFSILTCVDIFAVPYTLASVLRQCHNLIKVRFRVITKPITDEDILGSISISGSKETLQEFWIAPGSYKTSSGSPSNTSSESEKSSEGCSDAMIALTSKLIGNGEEAEVDDLCRLSIKCACKLIKLCKKLRRLGDLTWWSLTTASSVSNLCSDIKTLKLGIVITFDDILLPDFELPKKLKRSSTPVKESTSSK